MLHGGGHHHGGGHGHCHSGGGFIPAGYGYADNWHGYGQPQTIIIDRVAPEQTDLTEIIAVQTNTPVYDSSGVHVYTLAAGQKYKSKGFLGDRLNIQYGHDGKIFSGFIKTPSLSGGLSVSKDLKIVGDQPDYETMVAVDSFTPEQKTRAAEWWKTFETALNTTSGVIWNNKDFSASSAEILGLISAITPDFDGNNDKAVGLVNWLGGGGIYHGFFGKKPCWANSEDYLNAAKITTEGTQGDYTVSDLLLQLKKINPIAHNYIIYKAFAKAKKMKFTNDEQYHSVENPNVKKAMKAAEKLSDSVAGVPTVIIDATTGLVDGAKTGIQTASWLAEHWYIFPIGGVILLGGIGYFIWHNRKDVIEVANTAAKFTPAGRAMSLVGK